MYLVFYKTNDVFVAEERLQEQNIETEIVPTPVQDKAYCGVCVKVSVNKEIVLSFLTGMDYKIIE